MSKITQLLWLFCLMFSCVNIYAQENIWKKSTLQAKNFNVNSANEFLYELDSDKLIEVLNSKKEKIISFPDKEGNNVNFNIRRSSVLPSNLIEKYTNLFVFNGTATDGSGKKLRFTFSKETGIKASINEKGGNSTLISPLTKRSHRFSINNEIVLDDFECSTLQEVEEQDRANKTLATTKSIDDGYLRRFRIAVATTGEYSNYFLDGTENNDAEKKTKVLAAVAASIQRINDFFEIDFGITLQLIENNDVILFLDENTDPFIDDISAELQEELNSNGNIGSDAYDVGHVFHYTPRGGSGFSGCIGCVCNDNFKGRGRSAHFRPESESMNLLIAHEIGHQFGAFHTQSSSLCRSGSNSEVEPGSGSTIMSYAGTCSPSVIGDSEGYFNFTSIRDVAERIFSGRINCAELVSTTNVAPEVSAGEDYNIPISTAFVLTAEATDANSEDVLTYCWEQNDPEDPDSSTTPTTTQNLGPVFRSFYPSIDNKRYMPSLPDVIAGNLTPEWEVIPAVSRELNFAVTVRDNSQFGGQIVYDLMQINTIDTAGPFVVTSQNNSEDSWIIGEEVTVTWDVANTNEAPINTAFVDIYLSTNGGESFDTKIVENTENDGQINFTLPNVNITTEARVMVAAVDNIYYAVNESNIEIISYIASCDTVENITTDKITKNSIDIRWVDAENNSWEIEYGESGFLLGNGTTQNTESTFSSLENLNTATAYDIYVRSVCSDGGYGDYVSIKEIETTPNFCGGDLFYDTGGENLDYDNNEEYLYTIYPEIEDGSLKVFFNFISLESRYDFLYVYDGDSDNAELIETFSGEYTNVEVSSSNPGGPLTFKFVSDEAVTSSGWEASVICDETLSNPTNLILDDLKVYPTPNNGTFFIEQSNELSINQITIFDVNGRVIQKTDLENSENKIQYTIKNKVPGIYFIHIKTNRGLVTVKSISK